MLYQIYENTIGMIEELEKHEDHGTSAGNSGLLSHIYPKDTKKDKEDVSLPVSFYFHVTPVMNKCYLKCLTWVSPYPTVLLLISESTSILFHHI